MNAPKKKRERLEVIYDLLRIVRERGNSIKPTPLLRYSNLSSQRFAEYLAELLEKDLIRETLDKQERKHITLTDKGFKYLEEYQRIIDFIDDFNL